MTKSITNNKRIAKNTAFLYVRMFFVLIISLYTSRIILKTLGVEDYGVFNVVSGFVYLFGFLNSSLSASMQRFYNYEIGKQGSRAISSIYTIGLWTHTLLCIILLIFLETFGTWYINTIMVVPDGRLFAANCVFQTTVLSMILVIMQIPFVSIILAYERMNFYAFVSIIDVVLKLIIVLLLQYANYDKLIFYSALYMLIFLIDFVLYFTYAKKQVPELKLERRIQKEKFKDILSFSGWNLIGTFAWMINGQGLNMLLNVFFGPVVNAARGISYQVNAAVSSFTQSITTAFRPQVVESYAKNEFERVKFLFYTESKICFLLILFLINPIIMEIDFLLKLWLGEIVPDQTSIFTILVLINLLICTINPSIGQVAFASGNIKRYQIANSIVNICLIPTSLLVLSFGVEAVWVFLLTIIFSILNQSVCLLELDRIFNYNLKKYFIAVIIPCFITTMLSFLPQIVLHHFFSSSLYRFILTCTIDLTITTLLIYYIGFNKVEREYAMIILSKIKKRF